MKSLSFVLCAVVGLAFAGSAIATDHYVNGYTKKNGTYVAPHYQSNPNSTANDNYSTRGNTNPYTGQQGTKPRDEDRNRTSTPSYSDPAQDDDSSGN